MGLQPIGSNRTNALKTEGEHSASASRSLSPMVRDGVNGTRDRSIVSHEDLRARDPVDADVPPKLAEGEAAKLTLSFLEQYRNDPEGLVRALKNNEIPHEVFESQAGMLMLQNRLSEIQRMFQLMTNMIQAMHEMNMAIVRNIRA